MAHDYLAEMAMVRSGVLKGIACSWGLSYVDQGAFAYVKSGIEIHLKHGHRQANDWVSDM